MPEIRGIQQVKPAFLVVNRSQVSATGNVSGQERSASEPSSRSASSTQSALNGVNQSTI